MPQVSTAGLISKALRACRFPTGPGDEELIANLGTALRADPTVETPARTASEARSILMTLLALGASHSEAKSALVEMYSPPRVTKRLQEFKYRGLNVGTTFDLRPNGHGQRFDFTKAVDRARARHIVSREGSNLIWQTMPVLNPRNQTCVQSCMMNLRDHIRFKHACAEF